MKKLMGLILITVMVMSIFAGCGKCEHEYSEATCQKRAVCSKCGEETGELLAHEYSAATCSSPAKCKMCGGTTGKAKEHSTDFGKCAYCKEKINYKLYSEIKKYIDEAVSYSGKAVEKIAEYPYCVSDSQRKNVMDNVIKYYEKTKEHLEKAYNLCGSNPELSDLKKELKDAINKVPLKLNGGVTSNSVSAFAGEAKEYVYEEEDFRIEFVYIGDLFK